jgi:AcrR family transcriptional regulator
LRGRIAESALNQILKHGLRKFTIDDITTDLGISKKTIYKNFASKSQIIECVLDTYVTEELAMQEKVMASTQSFRERFEALILPAEQQSIPTQVLAELQQFYPELWEKCAEAVHITRNKILQIYAEGMRNGEIRSDVHPAVIDLVVKNAIDGVLDYRFLSENDISMVQALNSVKSMVLYGIMLKNEDSGGVE